MADAAVLGTVTQKVWGFESPLAHRKVEIEVVHDLKTWPVAFEAMWAGLKNYELRKNDRDFQVGDTLWLREWRPNVNLTGVFGGTYTGRSLTAEVTYKTDAGTFSGLEAGHVILGVRVIGQQDQTAP